MSIELPSILKEILRKKELRVEQAKREHPLDELKGAVRDLPAPKDFVGAISAPGRISIIAEMKRRSPSRGLIRKPFDVEEIQRAYEAGGADAISILTEEDFFGGSLETLSRVRQLSGKPLLRKDFIVDPYQIFEARVAGADAVLLIAAALHRETFEELQSLCKELGMATLLEVHNLEELEAALACREGIIGINNRDLHTFEVRLGTTLRLKDYVPPERVVVSESGIQGPNDIRRLAAAGIRAFLIGEYFMRAEDIAGAVQDLKGAL